MSPFWSRNCWGTSQCPEWKLMWAICHMPYFAMEHHFATFRSTLFLPFLLFSLVFSPLANFMYSLPHYSISGKSSWNVRSQCHQFGASSGAGWASSDRISKHSRALCYYFALLLPRLFVLFIVFCFGQSSDVINDLIIATTIHESQNARDDWQTVQINFTTNQFETCRLKDTLSNR